MKGHLRRREKSIESACYSWQGMVKRGAHPDYDSPLVIMRVGCNLAVMAYSMLHWSAMQGDKRVFDYPVFFGAPVVGSLPPDAFDDLSTEYVV